MPTIYYSSPIGTLEITASDAGITSLAFVDKKGPAANETTHPMLAAAIKQLDEYFAGKRKDFSLKIVPSGTVFQQSVLSTLQQIPFGRTASYKEVAEKARKPKAYRAVGMANNRNPLAILIPCHRVVGSNGSLTGYAGGLWRKEWLLTHEQSAL